MAVIAVAVSLLTASCSQEESDFEVCSETAQIDYSAYAGITLNVYNWGEYISDGSEGTVNVNKEFTRLTGIKINYTNYTSNEDMYAKIISGGASYDIIIPSDYMIERMITEGRLEKLDFSNIPNYKYIDSLYKDLYFDPQNEYSVPYNFGMVGLIYNKTMVSGTPDSWELMWNKDYSGNILMFNNPRDALAIAQFDLGIDVNTTDAAEWNKAYEKLLAQKPLVKAYVMDEVFNKMESGAAAIAPYYAGDFLSMYANNNDLAFYYPKEGTNVFVDSVCIPKGCSSKAAAELYINYLLDPNVALQNAETICYASPNTAVVENEDYREFLTELHPDAYSILYPDLEKLYPDADINDYYRATRKAAQRAFISRAVSFWRQLSPYTSSPESRRKREKTPDMKRFLAIIISAAVMLPVLSSCGDGGTPSEQPSQNESSTASGSESLSIAITIGDTPITVDTVNSKGNISIFNRDYRIDGKYTYTLTAADGETLVSVKRTQNGGSFAYAVNGSAVKGEKLAIPVNGFVIAAESSVFANASLKNGTKLVCDGYSGEPTYERFDLSSVIPDDKTLARRVNLLYSQDMELSEGKLYLVSDADTLTVPENACALLMKKNVSSSYTVTGTASSGTVLKETYALLFTGEYNVGYCEELYASRIGEKVTLAREDLLNSISDTAALVINNATYPVDENHFNAEFSFLQTIMIASPLRK